MKTKILLFLLCFILSSNVLSVTLVAKKKFPFSLITDDYGILNEEDLGHYTKIFIPKPFTEKDTGGFYWQCFPRELIEMTLEDMGYSSEDWGWSDTASDIKISVYVKPTVIHEYFMRRAYPLFTNQKKFIRWHKLMDKQKFVCLAGEFGRKSFEVREGVPREVYDWTFEKIKTKNGDDCLLGL